MTYRDYAPIGLVSRIATLEGVSNIQPPVWSSTPSIVFTLGNVSSYDLRNDVSDTDSPTLTFDLGGSVELPDGLVLNADGILQGTPTVAAVTPGIIVEAYDGTTAVPVTFTITVNASPVWLSTPAPSFVNGTAATYSLAPLVEGTAPIVLTLNTGGAVNNVTNECLYSEDFTGTGWSLGSAAITSDHAVGSFDGTAGEDYDRLQSTNLGGSGQSYVRRIATLTVNTQYVFGVHAVADNNDWLCIETETWTGGTNASQYFDLANGVTGADAGFDAYGIRDLGSGEYFCWVAMTVGPSDTSGWFGLKIADADGDKSVLLNGTTSILIGGAQIYEGATDNGSYVGPTTTAPVTEDIGGGGGGTALPTGVTYSDPVLTYNGVGAVATTTGHVATATDDNSQIQDSSSFSIVIAAAPTPPPGGDTAVFGRNGWFMTGGYQISNSSVQLVSEPWLTWNAEKDVLIPQNFGFYSTQVNKFCGFWKNVKAINPDCKILPYTSPSIVAKVSNSVSTSSYVKDNVWTGATPSDWALRDAAGAQVQSSYSSSGLRMSWTLQFQTNNVSGRNYMEEYAYKANQQVSLSLANGVYKDYIDGFYFDVVPPSPQNVYVADVVPRQASGQDFDQDASADGATDETDGLGVEANYGGARMYRRGAVASQTAWETEFGTTIQDKGLVIWRNSTRDGLNYATTGPLSNADAVADSEFYQAWGGGIFEDAQRSLCAERTGTEYPYQGYNGWEQQCRHLARIKTSNKPAASHPWGKFGEHGVLVEFALIQRTPTQADYEMARYGEFFARINGAMSGLSQGKTYPFPMLDESVPYVGDTHDNAIPIGGTLTATTPNGGANNDFVLRAADYTSGSYDFYWEMYELGGVRHLWVGRTDEGTLTSGDLHGTGGTATCLLPDYGAGNSGWTYLDATDTTYSNPYTGKGFRNQSPTINSGADVDAGGTYGAIDLLPFHARLLVSKV